MKHHTAIAALFLQSASAFSLQGSRTSTSSRSLRLAVGSTLLRNDQQTPPPLPPPPPQQRRSLPNDKQLSKLPLEKEALGAQLRAYRLLHRRPLVDVKHVKDLDLLAALNEPTWAPLFDLPATLSEATKRFFSEATPRFIVAVLAATLLARAGLAASPGSAGAFSAGEAGVAAGTALFWCFQEWALHEKLLHSPFEWFGKDIHAFHHDLPYYHLSVDGLDLAAAWFAVAAAAGVALAPTWAVACSAVGAYTLCGLVYEFAHFISHTKAPLPPRLAALRQHHMNHHLVSSRHWLAFTLPWVDAAMGTLPAHGARDVPAAERNHHTHNRQPLPPP